MHLSPLFRQLRPPGRFNLLDGKPAVLRQKQAVASPEHGKQEPATRNFRAEVDFLPVIFSILPLYALVDARAFDKSGCAAEARLQTAALIDMLHQRSDGNR
ncbi:hypothetical protein D3C73_1203420 [compost metagenome]